MPLEQIPILVQDQENGLTGQAEAVLSEVAALLEKLLAEGVSGSIDLRSLPMSSADHDWLRDRLGKGEVSISLYAGGASCINETGVAGVWWVEHRDDSDSMTGEFIEVAAVPSLVPAHPDDMKSGLAHLKTMIGF